MLVTVPFSQLAGNRVKGLLEGKKITAVPFVNVTMAELTEVSLYPERYKGVVFNYVDDINKAKAMNMSKGEFEIVVIYTPQTMEEIQTTMTYIPDYMTCVISLPEDYTDMRVIKSYCSMYPSIRFIGGHMLKIDGVRTGVVDNSFIGKKGKPTDIVTNGLDGVHAIIDFSQIEIPEFVKYKEKTTTGSTTREKKVAQPKEKSKPKEAPKAKKPKYDTSILFS